MSLTLSTNARRRLLGLTVASGLALSSLAALGPADAAKPAGSRAEVMLETGDASLDPDNAITTGWWGHEGNSTPTGAGATYLSMNGADGNGDVTPASLTALKAALGTDDLSNVYYAITAYSPDGSNEAPVIPAGQNAAETFDYILDANLGSALSGGNAANDSVVTVSTEEQITAWVGAGQPVQGYDDNLVLHDVTNPANPVSTAPQGSSILKTWQAGTQLSLVAYVGDGRDPITNNVVPIVKRDGDGKAQTAWMPFITVAHPTSNIRTSAGYQVMGAQKPSVTLSDSCAASTCTLTATVKNGAATATDATGNVEFREVIGGTPGAPTSAPTTNGVATLQVTIPPGGLKTYDVKYVPDVAAAGTYVSSDTLRKSVINEVVTTTTVKVTGSATKAVVSATVSPAGAAGNVAFTDGATSLGTAAVSGGKASVSPKLAAGKHTIKAVFTASDSTYNGSQGTTTVWVPKITSTFSPAPKVGKKTKLKLTFDTPGTSASGQVKVTVKLPGGTKKTFTATVKNGKATVNLGTVLKGKTKATIEYLGSATVLAATAKASFKV